MLKELFRRLFQSEKSNPAKDEKAPILSTAPMTGPSSTTTVDDEWFGGLPMLKRYTIWHDRTLFCRIIAMLLCATLLSLLIFTQAQAENDLPLNSVVNLTSLPEMPPLYDGALWKQYHGASQTEYCDMLARKSAEANWDLFNRSGACTEIDGVTVGKCFYRYLDWEPYVADVTAFGGYERFDAQDWMIRPIDDPYMLVYVLLTEYYSRVCLEEPDRMQEFYDWWVLLVDSDVRLEACEMYDWVTDGYDQGYVDALVFTEADDYYLFDVQPYDGTEPFQLLFRDYAYYDFWGDMSDSREPLPDDAIWADIGEQNGYGGQLWTWVDMGEAKDEPVILSASVDFVKPKDDGRINAIVTVDVQPQEGGSKDAKAQNVVLTAEGINGMSPREDDARIDLGSFSGTRQAKVHFQYHDPEGSIHPGNENPVVKIQISGNNCDDWDYSIEMDVQPQARLLSIYMYKANDDGRETIKQANDDVQMVFNGKIYDGKPLIPVEVKITDRETGELYEASYIDHPDALGVLEDFETDDNDITYIYLATHGLHDSEGKIVSQIYFPKEEKRIIDGKEYPTYMEYTELLENIENMVKGRVVLLVDACYSGQVIDTAQSISVDTKRFFVGTGTNSYYSEFATEKGVGTMMLSHLIKRVSDQHKNDVAACGDLKGVLRDPREKYWLRLQIGIWQLINIAEFSKMTNDDRATYIVRKILSDEMVAKVGPLKQLRDYLDSEIRKMVPSSDDSTTYIKEAIDLITEKIDEFGKKWKPNVVSDFLQDKIDYPWIVNDPQFYGNENLPLVFNDPDFDDHYRLPVPLEETVKTSEYEE